MNTIKKILFIHQKASEHVAALNEKILWSFHAVKKLRIEGLRKSPIEDALKDCVLVEDYPIMGRPLPDCLVLGFINEDPLHVVVALDEDFDRIFIITVYKPSLERWEDGWRKRKK